MSYSKWLALPALALAFCLTGCGPDTGTKVIEAEQQTEQEIIDADAAYDEQYGSEADTYEADTAASATQ